MLALLSMPAMAHEGTHTGSLLSGLYHPLAGADHLIAMVAAGLWVAIQKPAARHWLPVLFPLAMMVGAMMATGGTVLAGMESLIGLSVVALGILTVFSVRIPAWAGGLLLAVFALAQGRFLAPSAPTGAGAAASITPGDAYQGELVPVKTRASRRRGHLRGSIVPASRRPHSHAR